MKRKLGRPKTGQAALTRERILTTALRLVDEHGIEALSMRRLAAELEVDPMAIYHHLPSKQTLLTGLTDLVFADLRLPPADGSAWQDQVRAFGQAYSELVSRHPNLALHLIANMEPGSQALLAANEQLYTALAATGLPPKMIIQAADLVVDYLNGWALGTRGGLEQVGERQELSALLRQHPPERYPTMSRVFASLAEDEHATHGANGLDLILAGIAALAGNAFRPA